MRDEQGGPVLSVRDLRVAFRTPRGLARVVNGLSYDVEPGRTLAIVGESGSGKSVGALALLGLLPGDVARISGSAVFDGYELIGRDEEEMRAVRGAGVGMVFQDPATSLNPVLTVGRQLVEALRAHASMPKDVARARAEELLAEVGIPDPRSRLEAYPHQLSGGMRQRVMIAIALAGQPRVLIADEATTALDVTVQAQILDLLMRLQKEHSTGVIWITHDLGVVAGIADHVLVMYAGRCVEEGSVDALFERPVHPYTRGLLGATPVVDDPRPARERDLLVTMPGLPPDPVELPEGCAFYPRCPVRADVRCRTEEPPLASVAGDPGHRAATFYTPEGV
ncbi:ABC transporter ATP-binding protein [Actinobacteria bacterium YIM 96077]|uniref:ABC transporter ATP-binding protein n=1 Tax=Phytoactinopolyspora halophila TaxID=1981511 RepID=A0A329QWH5_9ACTN|nr:ABC transporter ATP-binding protein [Phytoactinopolyspora halophila]AYY12743.1 ABC transporter ATP-binding protein [Actinobacteria bacterium YIM 96077]RAW16463.1 ABC transporter ATP-binding protein [Phytoactinopolyspora halophila]